MTCSYEIKPPVLSLLAKMTIIEEYFRSLKSIYIAEEIPGALKAKSATGKRNETCYQLM